MRIAKSNGRAAARARGTPTLDPLEPRRLCAATTVTVPGTANPWLVTGQPMANPGTPPPTIALAAGTGRVITFPAVTGTITNGTASNGADGRAEKGNVTALGGLSGFKTDSGFFGLIGVFVTDAKPTSNPPATLDATHTRGNASVSPKLGQVFFIGDGKTGTGSGAVQTVHVPDGATRLVLGLPDADQFDGPPGQFADNGGSLSVTVETPSAPAGTGASIRGSVFKDADADGVKDPAETGLAGVTLYLDADNDGVKDATETTTVADSTGAYQFVNLAAGTYKVRQVVPAGYAQTTPTKNYGITITLGATTAATGKLFGDAPAAVPPVSTTATVSGTVFNDANANGKQDTAELGLGLWTVFLDTDKDGKPDANEKRVTTDVNGAWSFTGLAAGTYVVHVVQVSGTAATTGNSQTITLTAGQTVTGKLFGEKRIA